MAGKYNVVTSDTVSVIITTSKDEKCIPIEKHYKKTLTVKDLKGSLEVVTGASSATMTVKIYKDDEYIDVLDKDDALIGSYHIDDGMRLHVEDNFVLKRMFEDESNVEKYTMPPEEYNRRDERATYRSVSVGQSVPLSVSRGRGLVPINQVDRLNAVEVKKLRRPVVPPTALSLQDCSKDLSKAADQSERVSPSVSGSSQTSNLKYNSGDGKTAASTSQSFLNPNAREFFPDTLKAYLEKNKLGKYNPEETAKREAEKKREEEAEEAAAKEITVGNRCQVSVPGQPTRRAEVMFVGKTQFKPGWWIGVKYDEPMGKNDGSVNGVKYFECLPKYGGFVKPTYIKVGDFPEEDLGLDDEF